MTVTLYGIPNCDSVRKARAWLTENGVAYRFHDYKKDGVDAARLARWAEAAGWATLLNRAGTTYRKLPETERQVADAEGAIALMLAHPSAIKRPVVEHPGGILVGFAPERFGQAFC